MKKVLFLLIFALGGLEFVYTCGGWYDEYSHYKFLDYDALVGQNTQEIAQALSLFISEYYLYGPYQGPPEAEQDPNIEAWRKALKQKHSAKDIAEVVYRLPDEELKRLMASLDMGLEPQFAEEFAQNPWLKSLGKQDLPIIEYLILAKYVEQVAVLDNRHWWDDNWEDPRENNDMIDELFIVLSEKRKEQEKNTFLRQRYDYQLLRLARYGNKTAVALDLAKRQFGKNAEDGGYIYDRGLEHHAGLLCAEGKTAEGIYLFSRVFARQESRLASILMSVRFQSQENWDACLALCKNKEEEAVLHAIRALQPGGNSLEELQSIIEKAPQSPFIKYLLVKELSRLEFLNFHNNPWFDSENSTKIPKEQEMRKFAQFAEQAQNQLRGEEKQLMQMTQGLLHIALGDAAKAELLFAQLEQEPKLAQQARILKFISKIRGLRSISSEQEQFFAERFLQDSTLYKSQELYLYMMHNFAQLYEKQGEPTKAFLAKNSVDDLLNSADKKLLDEVLAVLQEEPMPIIYRLFLFKETTTDALLDKLRDIRSNYYLQRGEYRLALAELEAVSDASIQKLNETQPRYTAAIFAQHTNEFFDGMPWLLNPPQELQFAQEAPYLLEVQNKKSLLKALIRLDAESRKGRKKQRALASYYLGNALINMSPFAPFRSIAYNKTANSAYWTLSASDSLAKGLPEERSKDEVWFSGPTLYYNSKQALALFEQAMELSKDKELQARACFGAAQAQQFAFFMQQDNRWYEESNYAYKHPEYSRYYRKLKVDFSDTDYHKEVLEECSHYQNFYKLY